MVVSPYTLGNRYVVLNGHITQYVNYKSLITVLLMQMIASMVAIKYNVPYNEALNKVSLPENKIQDMSQKASVREIHRQVSRLCTPLNTGF